MSDSSLCIKTALDDCGTGYSRLTYLSRLRVDKIKVGKSFVRRSEHGAINRSVPEAAIALDPSLSPEGVAEGSESARTLEYLRRHGRNQAQGYYVCKPLTKAAFTNRHGLHESPHGDSS